jgi:MATE family multidrug resistance protein
MWANVGATVVNITFNYLLIFGKLGFPEMGIRGAAVATVISGVFLCLTYLILVSRFKYRKQYRIWAGWRWNRTLFIRLLRFGLPSGVLFFIDVFGFTLFLLLLGRLGTTALAATNIAFNINTFAFMPMIGIGVTVSVLVGQYLGDNNPVRAEYSVFSGLQLTVVYMTLIAVSYVALPGLYLYFYEAGADPAGFPEIKRIAVILLRFVALYSLFDAMNIIFSSALKGAGDTRFIMLMVGVMSSCFLVIPSYLAIVIMGQSLYTGWVIITMYVILLGFSFLWRFRGGKWKSMRVIEEIPPSLATDVPGSTQR